MNSRDDRAGFCFVGEFLEGGRSDSYARLSVVVADSSAYNHGLPLAGREKFPYEAKD
jgi:hypothetical protein